MLVGKRWIIITLVVAAHLLLLLTGDRWLHVSSKPLQPPLLVEMVAFAESTAQTLPSSHPASQPTNRPKQSEKSSATATTQSPTPAKATEPTVALSPALNPNANPSANPSALGQTPSAAAPANTSSSTQNANTAASPALGAATNNSAGASVGVVCVQGEIPAYPRFAQRNEQQGRVLILATIGPQGQVQQSSVKESSGYASLDNAALKSVQSGTWQFSPALQRGEAITAQILIPFSFFYDDELATQTSGSSRARCQRFINRNAS